MSLIASAAIAIAAAVSTSLPLTRMTPEQHEAAKQRQLSEEEAKALVVSDFNDPDAALFRSMRRKDQWSWCGEVNAKNLYGAYVGYRAFFVTSYFDPPVRLMRDPKVFKDLSTVPGCDPQ